jgi:hypothetical protein
MSEREDMMHTLSTAAAELREAEDAASLAIDNYNIALDRLHEKLDALKDELREEIDDLEEQVNDTYDEHLCETLEERLDQMRDGCKPPSSTATICGEWNSRSAGWQTSRKAGQTV